MGDTPTGYVGADMVSVTPTAVAVGLRGRAWTVVCGCMLVSSGGDAAPCTIWDRSRAMGVTAH